MSVSRVMVESESRKIKVILVDNDPDEIFFMLEGFESSKLFDILDHASSGDELLDLVYRAHQLPDVVITDLNMPGKSGVDIANELMQNYASIKVIVLSVGSENVDNLMNTKTGVYLYLPKPPSLLEYKSFAQELYATISADIFK